MSKAALEAAKASERNLKKKLSELEEEQGALTSKVSERVKQIRDSWLIEETGEPSRARCNSRKREAGNAGKGTRRGRTSSPRSRSRESPYETRA
jgi:hypothetical protein